MHTEAITAFHKPTNAEHECTTASQRSLRHFQLQQKPVNIADKKGPECYEVRYYIPPSLLRNEWSDSEAEDFDEKAFNFDKEIHSGRRSAERVQHRSKAAPS